jgi:RimJ/RimL family protein N-acetyltransferase
VIPSLCPPITLQTERLILRPWRPEDLVPWTALNQDFRVREFLGWPVSDAMCVKQMNIRADGIAQHGWGRWAAELRVDLPSISAPGVLLPSGSFIGFVGLGAVEMDVPWSPPDQRAVELAWRLCQAAWGAGLAPEGARAAINFGFEQLKRSELVAYTAVQNANSRRVMEKLGMTRDAADDFDHPNEAADSHLLRHVLYRLKAREAQKPHRATQDADNR